MLTHISDVKYGSLNLKIFNSDEDDNFVVRFKIKEKVVNFRYDLRASVIFAAIDQVADGIEWDWRRIYRCSTTKEISMYPPDGNCQSWCIAATNKNTLRFVRQNRDAVASAVQEAVSNMLNEQTAGSVFSHFADAHLDDNSFPVMRDRSDAEVMRSIDDPLALRLVHEHGGLVMWRKMLANENPTNDVPAKPRFR